MNIVEFENGKFGVRKRTLFGDRFLNIGIPHMWEKRGQPYFNQCMTNKEQAEKSIERFKTFRYRDATKG